MRSPAGKRLSRINEDGSFELALSSKRPALWTWLELQGSDASFTVESTEWAVAGNSGATILSGKYPPLDIETSPDARIFSDGL